MTTHARVCGIYRDGCDRYRSTGGVVDEALSEHTSAHAKPSLMPALRQVYQSDLVSSTSFERLDLGLEELVARLRMNLL
jgi:hypothetical protein